MKKLFFLGVLGFAITGCHSSKTYFLMISDKITKTYVKKKFQKRNLSKKAREIIYEKTSFLREIKKDTIYILERYNLETSSIDNRIWTKQNYVDYTYLRTRTNIGLVINNSISFSNKEINLVTKWDTIGIRKQEMDLNNFVTSDEVNAYRCINTENQIKIEGIRFKDFIPKNEL